MRRYTFPIAVTLVVVSAASHAGDAPDRPPRSTDSQIRLHSENPHYFWFRGKPAVLITSTEHYGAVLNGDFDTIPYLEELHARGLNLTRTFSGTYREVPGSFRIARNTLAPSPDKYIAPWPRTATPGAIDGSNRFDL